jgi:hypothetical protein
VDHSFIDQRSLAFHVAITEKLRLEPELLNGVRDRLKRISSDSRLSHSTRDAYREWLEFIERHSFKEVLAFLVDPSEEGNRLRQATPFSGILTPEERAAITLKVASIHR